MNNERIKLQALKYGNRLHYEWEALLLERTDSHIFVLGERGRQLHHYTRGAVYTIPHWTIEFFPFDSWFTVSADIVDGDIHQYYCNVNEPARIAGSTVSYVDLDLDYVYRGGQWKVVDEDEFELHTIEFGYPEELVRRAREELALLQRRIDCKLFPFDGSIGRFIESIPGGG